MSTVVLSRLRELFLAPVAEPAPAARVAERAVPATLAVLAAPQQASVAGAALGLAVAGARDAPCAVVCVWTGAAGDAGSGAPRSDLAAAAARRLARRLAARGLAVGARGRLVTVVLPAADVEARAAAERAMAAAGEAPVVLVVAGPRPAGLDPLLSAVDRVVVVPRPDAPAGLEDLALSAAARLGRATAVLRLPASSGAGRALASAGLALSPALRAATASTIGGDRG